ncbi:hypothetical protein LCGC14_2131580 [marine sediment metagenome]|uniref:Uncharacterized protein n=1 Tax=marine sediment metagenome TaxID=412755 RepID=A0A0F9GXC9_9ZZZZ
MIKRWLKKMNEPVPFDPFLQSRSQCIFVIIALALFVVLSVWANALAQPELKVGQEVEVFYDGVWILCPKIVGFETDFEGFKELICVNPTSPYTNTFHQPLDKADGYRILNPAPRPEFSYSIPAAEPCTYEEGWKKCVYTGPDDELKFEDIAKELRHLREEIGAIKK